MNPPEKLLPEGLPPLTCDDKGTEMKEEKSTNAVEAMKDGKTTNADKEKDRAKDSEKGMTESTSKRKSELPPLMHQEEDTTTETEDGKTTDAVEQKDQTNEYVDKKHLLYTFTASL